MKLGISKNELLSDVKIAKLYDEYKKQKGSGRMRMKGAGLWEGFVKFLKDSKVLSNVGGVLLPAAGAALGGTLGTAFSPVGTATGAALGTAAGKSGAEWLKSQGFGRRKIMMRGGDSRLAINPVGTRLGQKGKMRGGAMTLSTNGTFQQVPGTPAGYGYTTQMGRGITSFNTVSSQFGNIKA